MSLRSEIVRLVRYLLAAVGALIGQACEALWLEAESLNRETERRRALRVAMKKQRMTPPVPPTHEDRLALDRLVYGEHFDERVGGELRCLPWAEGQRRRATVSEECQ